MNADPGMVNRTGIPHFQLCWNALRPQHRGHDRSIVKAYACSGVQNIIHRRDISALYRFRFICIIGDVADDIIINVCHNIQITVRCFCQFTAQGYHCAGGIKIHILVGIEKWAEFVCYFYWQSLDVYKRQYPGN